VSTNVDANNQSTESTIKVDPNNHPSVGHLIVIFLRALASTIVDANKHPSASISEMDANKHALVSIIVDPVGRSILIVFYSFIFA
jgi:hypothetical protein